MFHPSTERLIDYWRSKAVNDGVPARAAVNPGDFLDLLPQVFILGRDEGPLSGAWPAVSSPTCTPATCAARTPWAFGRCRIGWRSSQPWTSRAAGASQW
jgi:hypothetical protein